LNSGWKACKLSFKILLAENYRLFCQSNELEREIKHKTEGAKLEASQKAGGHGLPRPPLRIATAERHALLALTRDH